MLIDWGVEGNFMDYSFALQMGMDPNPLQQPKKVDVIDGKLLVEITHSTALLQLYISTNIVGKKFPFLDQFYTLNSGTSQVTDP